MPTSDRRISSGSPFESTIGFSRAVRRGPIIAVSGTAPIAADGSVAHPGDVAGQTQRCLDIVRQAVQEAGASLADVIRTRVFLTDMSRWEEAAEVHGRVFADIRPASTFVEVSSLINKEWLVEIEADCYIASDA
jgi:enamine deaminase RidA (YjgF/YER057c/UK114 family)